MSKLLFLLFQPTSVYALENRFVVLSTGVRITWVQAISNITAAAILSAAGICTLLFLFGALTMVFSMGDQTKVTNAKNTMMHALIGLAIILSAYAMLRTVLYFLYAQS